MGLSSRSTKKQVAIFWKKTFGFPNNFRRLAKLGARANYMFALIAAHLRLTPGELLVERGRRSMYVHV